jgi:hypothetical protein
MTRMIHIKTSEETKEKNMEITNLDLVNRILSKINGIIVGSVLS